MDGDLGYSEFKVGFWWGQTGVGEGLQKPWEEPVPALTDQTSQSIVQGGKKLARLSPRARNAESFEWLSLSWLFRRIWFYLSVLRFWLGMISGSNAFPGLLKEVNLKKKKRKKGCVNVNLIQKYFNHLCSGRHI